MYEESENFIKAVKIAEQFCIYRYVLEQEQAVAVSMRRRKKSSRSENIKKTRKSSGDNDIKTGFVFYMTDFSKVLIIDQSDFSVNKVECCPGG